MMSLLGVAPHTRRRMYPRTPRRRFPALLLCALLAAALAACAPHEMVYRPETGLCASPSPAAQCREHALQAYRNPHDPAAEYTLGFIELDDQGQLQNRAQMNAVLGGVYELAAHDELLMVVFVHGWKHNAAPGDPNIDTLRDALMALSRLESKLAAHPRRVVGLYLGWRGASVTVPGVEQLSFWDRKSTAHKVGRGGTAEVLGRIEQIKRVKDALRDQGAPAEGGGAQARTRLVVVGHSFGGAVVYTALAHALMSRFVITSGRSCAPDPDTAVCDAAGFGDLVVLVNPAFEAIRFSALSDMANERRTYFETQRPVLAILTSEADDATRRAFPLGRFFSTLFDKHRRVARPNPVTGEQESIDQYAADITAIGHFEPYRTHRLVPAANAGAALSDRALFFQVESGWVEDGPGKVIRFGQAKLVRSHDTVARNPYLVIGVDRALIADHNDFYNPRIAEFLTQLIQLSAQSPERVRRLRLESVE